MIPQKKKLLEPRKKNHHAKLAIARLNLLRICLLSFLLSCQGGPQDHPLRTSLDPFKMPNAAEVLDSFLLKLDYKIELSPRALKSMEFKTYHDFDFLQQIPLNPLESEQANYFKVGRFSEMGFWRVERIIENRLSFMVHIHPRGNFFIYDAYYVEQDSLVPLKGLIFKEAGRDEILFFSSMYRLSSSRAARFLIRTIEKLDSRLEVQ